MKMMTIEDHHCEEEMLQEKNFEMGGLFLRMKEEETKDSNTKGYCVLSE